MAFTKALYYPWIDITNDAWLKNSLLYWDKIHTIVPASVEQPYSNKTARECSEADILVPHRVGQDGREVRELADDVLKYMDSPEGKWVLSRRSFRMSRTPVVRHLRSST
jgi:hypothetical protein